MENLRQTVQFALAAVASVAVFIALATVGLFMIGLTLVLGAATAIGMRLAYRRAPVPVRTDRSARRPAEPRIWNDGRGKIIDL